MSFFDELILSTLHVDHYVAITGLSWLTAISVLAAGAMLILFLRLRATRDTAEAAHTASGQGSILVAKGGKILQTNGPARALLWPKTTEGCPLVLHQPIRELLKDETEQHHLLRLDSDRLVELSISSAQATSRISAVRGIAVRDVTEQRRGERHLVQLAHYDSLTGLGNRRLFIDRLEAAITRAENSSEQVALFYIDLDRFKNVNDTLGHGAGDELLKTLATRFRNYVAGLPKCGPGDEISVSRLAGDEFAIIMPRLESPAQAEVFAQDVLAIITEPMTVVNRTIASSGSVGVALYPDHAKDVEDLVKHADSALYVAKDLGRARFVFYEPSFSADADRSHRIDQALRKALDRNEFVLHYQPKVDVKTQTVAGFEALLRWYNAELGFVGPKEFIPVAEDRGMIAEIGAWCLDEACRQIKVWREAGFEPVPVSVNVSSAQFRDSDVQALLANALVASEVEPALLEIELTESLLLEDDERTGHALRELRAMGVGVALDDFGTGYSALTYLNRFPLDVVKMDRGFLRDIEDSDAAAGIAAAVISMSHSLGFKVVAEGVDSPAQAALLKTMDCDLIQGFLYAPAIPSEEATQFLAAESGARPHVRSIIESSATEDVAGPGLADEYTASADHTEGEHADTNWIREKSTGQPVRLLVVDLDCSTLKAAIARLARQNADIHSVASVADARRFVREEGPRVDLVISSPDVDLDALGVLNEEIKKVEGGQSPRLLLAGTEPSTERREQIRNAGVDWVLWEPFADPELRFFLNAARSNRDWRSRRQTVRVPFDAIAWVRAGGERGAGILTSLSRRGAFIETSEVYEIGQPIRIEFKIDSQPLSLFGNVTRVMPQNESDDGAPGAGIDVIFYEVDSATDLAISEGIERLWLRYRP